MANMSNNNNGVGKILLVPQRVILIHLDMWSGNSARDPVNNN